MATAIVRLELGNLSNVKWIGGGLGEYRIDWGPGYRLYLAQDGDERALQQINNQITSLQNVAQMLRSGARNLTGLNFTALNELRANLARTRMLIDEAQGLAFNVTNLDTQFRRLYPGTIVPGATGADLAGRAHDRWTASLESLRTTMQVQAQVSSAISDDETTLASISGRSSSAVGSPSMTRTLLLLTLSASVLLAGCATHGTSAPAIALDPPPEIMTRATPVESETRPVEIVAVPEPLPLPGQLKPLGGTAPPEPGKPAERVTQAIAAARVAPARDGFVNAVQLWPWTQGALYQLYSSPGRVTDIALQPGEDLVSVSTGDTVRWIIGDTTSGTRVGTQVHTLVKPTRSDLKTNMLIHTDRRSYKLELTADRAVWMASAAWSYPQDELISRRAANARAEATTPIADGVAIEQLRFRYRISGDDPAWRPVQAFDDGARVNIQFPAGIAQGEMPPLFVIGAKGEAQIVNYRARSPYYVVDGLFGAAELRLGEHPQQVVRIERNDGRRRARDGR